MEMLRKRCYNIVEGRVEKMNGWGCGRYLLASFAGKEQTGLDTVMRDTTVVDWTRQCLTELEICPTGIEICVTGLQNRVHYCFWLDDCTCVSAGLPTLTGHLAEVAAEANLIHGLKAEERHVHP